jgi:hypothetical protein
MWNITTSTPKSRYRRKNRGRREADLCVSFSFLRARCSAFTISRSAPFFQLFKNCWALEDFKSSVIPANLSGSTRTSDQRPEPPRDGPGAASRMGRLNIVPVVLLPPHERLYKQSTLSLTDPCTSSNLLPSFAAATSHIAKNWSSINPRDRATLPLHFPRFANKVTV